MPNNESSETFRELTDDELLAGVWVGKKTGNFFKVTAVKPGPPRVAKYKKSTGEEYEIEVKRFMSRFKPMSDEDAWEAIAKSSKLGGLDGEENLVTMITPDHRHDFNRIILQAETKSDVLDGLNLVLRKKEMDTVWEIKTIEPRTSRAALNFYGKPGTGKTLTAGAIAHKLGKKLMTVDYSQVVSKWVGDTAKHIKAVFDMAKADNNAVLFWDEADALVSRRVDLSNGVEAYGTSINQNRACLLTALDSYDGVVIFATNKFGNYDEAFVRRIAQHVEFKLPTQDMRYELLKIHMPTKGPIDVNDGHLQQLAAGTEGLAGGDILNVVLNSINKASSNENTKKWKLTFAIMEREAAKIMAAKRAHAVGAGQQVSVED